MWWAIKPACFEATGCLPCHLHKWHLQGCFYQSLWRRWLDLGSRTSCWPPVPASPRRFGCKVTSEGSERHGRDREGVGDKRKINNAALKWQNKSDPPVLGPCRFPTITNRAISPVLWKCSAAVLYVPRFDKHAENGINGPPWCRRIVFVKYDENT